MRFVYLFEEISLIFLYLLNSYGHLKCQITTLYLKKQKKEPFGSKVIFRF